MYSSSVIILLFSQARGPPPSSPGGLPMVRFLLKELFIMIQYLIFYILYAINYILGTSGSTSNYTRFSWSSTWSTHDDAATNGRSSKYGYGTLTYFYIVSASFTSLLLLLPCVYTYVDYLSTKSVCYFLLIIGTSWPTTDYSRKCSNGNNY